MTRRVLLVTALLSLASRPSAASDQLVWLTDQEDPARPPVLISDFEYPADALKAVDRNDLRAKQALYNALTLEPPVSTERDNSRCGHL